MNFLRSALGQLSGKGAAEAERVGTLLPAQHERFPRVLFNKSDPQEAQICQLWGEYQAAKAIDGRGERALNAFLSRFISVFEVWEPEDAVPSSAGHIANKSGNSGGIFSRGQSRAEDAVEVTGCVGAHPFEVLQGMVENLGNTPNDISTVLRQQDAGLAEMENAGGLKQLHVLTIMARSHQNRMMLLSVGCLPALMRLMKIAIMRLNTLAAIAAVERNMSHVSRQLVFLQCLLAHVVSVLDSYVDGELTHWARLARTTGKLLDPSAGETIIRPLIEEGALSFFVELLRVLWLLRVRGAQAAVVGKLEELVLNSIKAAVQASSTAQKHLRSVGGLEVLLDSIGWPADQPRLGAGSGDIGIMVSGNEVPRPRQLRSRQASEELRAQLLTLQVVGYAVRRNNANMMQVREVGGFRRITQLLQWVALTFTVNHSATGAAHGRSGSASSSRSRSAALLQQDDMAHHRDLKSMAGFSELQELFGVLLDSWIGANETTEVGSSDTKSAASAASAYSRSSASTSSSSSTTAIVGVASDKLLVEVVGALLDVFRDGPTQVPGLPLPGADLVHHRTAVQALRIATCTLQRFTLALLNQVLNSRPSILEALREHGMWQVLVGPSFFFFGNVDQLETLNDAASRPSRVTHGSLSKPPSLLVATLVADEASGSVRLSLSGGDAAEGQWYRQCHVPDGQVVALREHVVSVMEAFAGLAAKGSTGDECSKLVEVLYVGALEEDIVLLLSPALRRLLSVVPATTIQSLLENNTLGLISRAILRQQQADGNKVQPSSETNSRNAETDTLWRARCAMISLLVAYLETGDVVRRMATGHADIIKALFGLLWEARTQAVGLKQLLTLMCTKPASDADRGAKKSLFAIYIKTLSVAKAQVDDDNSLLSSLLSGIQQVVTADQTANQNLFRQSGAIAGVANLLSAAQPSFSEALLEDVLSTIRMLLAGNPTSRSTLQQEVGYDRLQDLILATCSVTGSSDSEGSEYSGDNGGTDGEWQQAGNSSGPSLRVFLCMMDLLLERKYDANSVNQVIANPEVVTLFFAVLRRARMELQTWGLDAWSKLVSGSVANLSACNQAGLNMTLLDWLSSSNKHPHLQERIAAVLQTTASHSISGRELYSMLSLLTDQPGRWPHCATLVLAMLKDMVRQTGPSVFFDFGDAASGIVRTTPLRWSSRGYTFATWLRIESPSGEAVPLERTLFSFLHRSSGLARGAAAWIKGQQVCISSVGKSYAEVTLPFRLVTRQWHHIVVVHSAGGPLSSAGVTLYIDGEQVAASRLRYPKCSDALNCCCIGARQSAAESGIGRQLNAFAGQMAAVYLFDDCLALRQVQALCKLGADYCGVFSATESSDILQQAGTSSSLLLESKDAVGPQLIMSYNPQAASGRMLFDAVTDMAPSVNVAASSTASGGKAGTVRQAMESLSAEVGVTGVGSAALLQGTALCVTNHLRDVLFGLGGVTVFFPLLSNLDAPRLASSPSRPVTPAKAPPVEGGPAEERAGQVIGLLSAILEKSPCNRLQFIHMDGPGLLGFLLARTTSEQHLSVTLLKALEGLYRIMGRDGPDAGADGVATQLLLNVPLWSTAKPAVQRQYHATLMRLAKDERDMLRKYLCPAKLVDWVRLYLAEAPISKRLDPEDLCALRRGLLDVAATMVRAAAMDCPSNSGSRPSSGSASARGGSLVRSKSGSFSGRMGPADFLGGACGVLSGDDLAAYLSLLTEVKDEAVLEDVLDSIISLLQPGSTTREQVKTVISALGGINLLLPMLRLPSATARELGLRILFCLRPEHGQIREDAQAGGTTSGAATPGGTLRDSVTASGFASAPSTPRRSSSGFFNDGFGGLDNNEDWGEVFWEEVADAVLAYPITDSVWGILLEVLRGMFVRHPGLLRGSGGVSQAKNLEGGTLPQISRLVLRCLSRCGSQRQRLDGLQQLLAVAEGCNPVFVGSLTSQPGWYEALVDLLKDGGHASPGRQASTRSESEPSAGSASGHSGSSMDMLGNMGRSMAGVGERVGAMRRPWEWIGPEADLTRRLLCVCHTNAIRYLRGGHHALERSCSIVRTAALVQQLDGWGLINSLLCDVVKALLATAAPGGGGTAEAGSSSWVDVPPLSTSPCRENVLGLLGLLDELTSGVLLSPQTGGAPSLPSRAAVQWADQTSGKDSPQGELPFGAEVWATLGAPSMQGRKGYEGHWNRSWELFSNVLQLMGVLTSAGDMLGYTPGSAATAGGLSSLTLQRRRSSGSFANFLTQDEGEGGSGLVVETQVVEAGATLRALRISFRLLLLYMQQAPLDIATKGVTAVLELVPQMLLPDYEPCWDMAHYMVYALSWARDCIDPSNSVGGSLNSRVASMLGHESSGEARLTLARRSFIQMFEACCDTIARSKAPHLQGVANTGFRTAALPQLLNVDPNDGEGMSEILEDERIVRCVTSEILFLSYLATSRGSAVGSLAAEASLRAESLELALSGFHSLLTERTASLAAADRARQRGLQLFMEEQRQQLTRTWERLQRRRQMEDIIWDGSGEGVQAEVHWRLDRAEDSSRRRLRLKVNNRFVMYHDKWAEVAQQKPADEESDGALSKLTSLPPEAIRGPGEEAEEEEEAGDDGSAPAGDDGRRPSSTGSVPPEDGGAETSTEQVGASVGEYVGEAHAAAEPKVVDETTEGQDGQVGVVGGAVDDVSKVVEGGVNSASEDGTVTGERFEAHDEQTGGSEAVGEVAVEPQAAAQASQSTGSVAEKPPASEEGSVRDCSALAQSHSVGSGVSELVASSSLPELQALTISNRGAEDAQAENLQIMNGEEMVLHSCVCSLVTYKQVIEGRLELTRTHIHFVGELTEGAGEAVEGGGNLGADGNRRYYKRWPTAEVAQVHYSRYMLQPTALEIFTQDRSSVFLNFSSKGESKDISDWLSNLAPSAVVYDRRKKVELAERLAARWRRWEITNFDYLMQLNTLAGRTYNDLNQYPVFPWVLQNYSSDRLDLNDPASFRDLSRPVGALDDSRLAFFQERYNSLKDDIDTPPFHYGSHYSTCGIVLFYMLRLEPFTFLARQLQGRRFDHADRMFHSMAEVWQGVKENTSDTKELIPEFYYNPEFLLNSDGFNLGQRQDGTVLGDVELPPWANNSADEFVRIMREALESEYVSQHLHEWIDLIFGFKQRGKAAEEAVNVFYYLTYEGAVDLDAITDDMQRGAVRDQIGHFGQTPAQLFRRRHVKRGSPPLPSLNPLLNAPETMIPTAVGFPTGDKRAPIVALAVAEARAVMVTADCLVQCHKWVSPRRDTSFSFGGETGYSIELDGASPRRLRGLLDRSLGRNHLGCCMAVAPGGRIILTGGHMDGSLRATAVDDGRLLQVLIQHKAVLTCVEVTEDGSTVVTGSRDTNIIVWDAHSAEFTSPSSSSSTRTQRRLPLKEQPRVIIYGHKAPVVCLAVSTELDLVASGGQDGLLLLHTLRSGSPVHSMYMQGGVAPSLLALDVQQRLIIVHSHQDLALQTYTVNGRHVARVEGVEELHALCCSPCDRFLMTGGERGMATLRWLHSLAAVIQYEIGHGPITALTITPEECLLIGSADGSLVLFSPDMRRHITRRLLVIGANKGKTPPPTVIKSGDVNSSC